MFSASVGANLKFTSFMCFIWSARNCCCKSKAVKARSIWGERRIAITNMHMWVESKFIKPDKQSPKTVVLWTLETLTPNYEILISMLMTEGG